MMGSCSDQEILNAAVEGEVVTSDEALRLVEEAKLEDLLLAADLLRRRVFRDECIGVRQLIEGTETIKENNMPKRFMLCPKRFSSIKQYEDLFMSLEGLPVEFADLEGLLELAKKKGITYINLAKRLAKAGLRMVFVDDDAYLLKSKYSELWAAFHGLGIRTAFRLKLEKTWDKSLAKMAKLRKIQEKSAGISYVEIPLPQNADTIRFACIARLYLDNIPNIAVATEIRNLQSELASLAGVSEIILDKSNNIS